MNKIIKAAVLCSVVLLASCGGNAKVTKSFDNSAKAQVASQKMDVRNISTSVPDAPEHFLAAVKGHLKNELRKRGLLSDHGDAHQIDLNVTYYRMRSGFTRMMFGMFAGKDGIEAEIEIKNADSGKVLSALTASSYNITAIGNEDDVARMFAEEAAEEIEKSLK